jgi:hypothetical protein
MTDNCIAATATPAHALSSRDAWSIALGAFLTVLADWLFFRQSVGISLALFVMAVSVSVLLANRVEANRRTVLLHLGVLIVALLPLLEAVSVFSVLIAVVGLAWFALSMTTALSGDFKQRMTAVGWFLLSGPFRIVADLSLLRAWAREHGSSASAHVLKGWIIPLGLGATFIALFAAANPLIANFLTQWNAGASFKQFDLVRPVFWLATIGAIWMFLRIGRRFALPNRDDIMAAVDADLPTLTPSGPIFNDAAVLRSLVLFNVLFAMQSVLDLNYLWRGAALPDGMTYASYAHRGAYPLIITALLAAGFVIVAMRPGSQAERSPLMRALVFLWVGQNMLLVASSILRLQLYVATYSLTYWRVAAFIWMLVVVAGLVLIAARIMTHRSNAWLISMNLATVALTVYACTFVNFPNLVASYNVETGIDRARYRLCHESRTAGHPRDRSLHRSAGDIGADRARLSQASRRLASQARGRLAGLDVPRLAAHALFERPRNWRLNTPLSLLRHSAPNRYMDFRYMGLVRAWLSEFSSSMMIRYSVACCRA